MMAGEMLVTTLDLDDPAQRSAADKFVMAHPAGTPFHRPAWLTGVERGTGNRAHMLAAVAPSGEMTGLLPLHHVKSALFGQALVSSGFAVDGGILASDPAAVPALAAACEGMARDGGIASVEIRGGPAPGRGWALHEGSHLGFARPIAADDEAELLAVPRKHRAELRKALANDALRVEIGREARHRQAHYRVYSESVRNLGTPVFPARLFREVLAAFGEDADILAVYEGKRPVSAVLTLYHQGRVMPFWGGGIADARRLRSNELMYFRLMGHGRARGMRVFDFGRSKTGSGQAAWKKSFGFDPVPLSYHSWSATGERRDIDPNSPHYQRRIDLWKKLPLPVANLIGPLIARGLG
ncbi:MULTISPECIES: FemAB family XrtA/PEP-CTERM system-associated protein [Sphingobium]|uniref:Peptidoglycan bridge formation protein FemAB n=1 Tax=Sphingobium fuliginis (strain ATCC 27551) TaxID=336203 RepID=A0ABQ1EZ19_SPHSA|nr:MULTISPECIES: FemAB family XrtA/PEP-CTERM system-associated protein [Sphingobium]AJR24930.1 FemAB [Sphingobium sp. YBL2]RYL97761.1 FemAB family PEP-CTERM system-associated protein [Sphingobium fuliginis]WDA37129.1 FemAB family PEP-CTERM system-associated protein [Sphingobium sp. YC-XJ3]GFZ93138.1 peptidoglycan bridge formation protein FemAB [Sphingobium fuliginis]